MKRGDLVYTNLFGEENHSGILIDVRKLPTNSLEFFSCKVLLTNGTVKRFTSSQLLTTKDVEWNNINGEDH